MFSCYTLVLPLKSFLLGSLKEEVKVFAEAAKVLVSVWIICLGACYGVILFPVKSFHVLMLDYNNFSFAFKK